MVFKRRDQPSLLTRLREMVLPRGGWRRGLQYLGHRVRRIPDTPHRIALGCASGIFVSFTPFFGLHLILAIVVARLVRGNIFASLIGTLVGNPATFPFIASVSLWLGRRILGYGATGRDFSRVSDAFAQAATGIWHSTLAVFGAGESEWSNLLPFVRDVFWPYFVGGLLPGLAAAVAGYYVARPLIAAYQLQRRAHVIQRAGQRAGQWLRRKSEADGAGRRPYKPRGADKAKDGSEE